MPVVINSGSGNQGMTASLPVIKYAQHIGATREQLYRALVLSNLIAIHQKTGLGRLSAYCGAVSAAVGSGAAITYLYGGSYEPFAIRSPTRSPMFPALCATARNPPARPKLPPQWMRRS